ncbi:hypothetical protein KKD52_08760 [Myxococcota bacterium]|nr:hypothetical protein [Myxococcota bacterium]MBU1410559.1 hypothetical protein [Myxococcota bacterium]MBU1510437.1 hypothetical protein [Myxococcota bacterium]
MHPLTELWPRVFTLLAQPGFDQRLAAWKDQFWMRTGIPHPGETGYESRMHMFEEWVLLDLEAPRPLLGGLLQDGQLPEPDASLAQALLVSQHGLFVLMAPWTRTARFRDLLSGADFRLDEQPPVAGLEPGQILQTRFFAHENQVWAGLGRLVHPRGATEIIHRRVALLHAQGRTRLEILHLLSKLAWRSEHYPRHAPEAFYDFSHPLVQDIVADWM